MAYGVKAVPLFGFDSTRFSELLVIEYGLPLELSHHVLPCCDGMLDVPLKHWYKVARVGALQDGLAVGHDNKIHIN